MISQTHANSLLNYTFGMNQLSRPTYVYLGLCANEPAAADGTITGEPALSPASSYARKAVGGSSADTQHFNTSASGGIIRNSSEIQLNTIRDEGGLGNMKYWFLTTSNQSGAKAILWGGINWNEDTQTFDGLDLNYETVPVFYAGDLQASIDVALT